MTHVHDWRTAVPGDEFEDTYDVCRTCFVRRDTNLEAQKQIVRDIELERMADLDTALAAVPPENPTSRTTAAPRRHRHVYDDKVGGWPDEPNDLATWSCKCGAIQDPDRSRRGKQVRNYGNRAELDVARTYGGRKVGHAQGPTDVQGTTRKVQVKTTRRSVPAMWRNEFAKLESERDGRLAILLLRFIRSGGAGPDDYFVIKGKDFLEWYGRDGD